MSSQGGLDGADGGGGDPIATRYRNISWILDRTHNLDSLSIMIWALSDYHSNLHSREHGLYFCFQLGRGVYLAVERPQIQLFLPSSRRRFSKRGDDWHHGLLWRPNVWRPQAHPIRLQPPIQVHDIKMRLKIEQPTSHHISKGKLLNLQYWQPNSITF